MADRKEGFVALLDVLGFSDRVTRGSLDGLDTYIKVVEQTTRNSQSLGKSDVRTILFSDTVVLYTLNDSSDSFDSIISTTSTILHDLIAAKVPVRGAISHGAFSRSAAEHRDAVIAGRPIIDAHYYESRSQWIGVMLTPALLEHRTDITANRCSLAGAATEPTPAEQFSSAKKKLMIQVCPRIPLTDERGTVTEFEGFAIVPVKWQSTSVRDLRDGIDASRRTLERLRQLAPESRSQAKYRQTEAWLQHVRNTLVEAFGHKI